MPWTQAPLVALDLEGTGAQDRDDEGILEIALVPITAGRPSLDEAYTTLINPGRPIPRRPWISPGLTDATLATAPPLSDIAPELTHGSPAKSSSATTSRSIGDSCIAAARVSSPPASSTRYVSPGTPIRTSAKRASEH